jgi:hypothetical protein
MCKYVEAFPGPSFVLQLYYLPNFTCVISVCSLLRKLLRYGKITWPKCDNGTLGKTRYTWLVRGLKTGFRCDAVCFTYVITYYWLQANLLGILLLLFVNYETIQLLFQSIIRKCQWLSFMPASAILNDIRCFSHII